MATRGLAPQELEAVYTRALELCRQVGETPQLFPVLWGLRRFYLARAELHTARELAERLLILARHVQDPALLVEAFFAQGTVFFSLGEFALAREHIEQGIALYDPQLHRSHAFVYGLDPAVGCLSYAAVVLWFLGYPSRALKRSQEMLNLAQELSHPPSLALSLVMASVLHQLRQERQATQEWTETLIALSNEQEAAFFLAIGNILQGRKLAERGQREEGIAYMHQGLAAHRATGAEVLRPYFLALLAEAYGKAGQTEDGLVTLADALAVIDKSGERSYEAELYRLKGELTLQQSRRVGIAHHSVSIAKSVTVGRAHPTGEGEAEACFLKAIEVARHQQAKSLELRAVMSLVRLRQHQATQSELRITDHELRTRLAEAHKLLSEVYNWFTEGFDTKDLQEAKALLEAFAAA